MELCFIVLLQAKAFHGSGNDDAQAEKELATTGETVSCVGATATSHKSDAGLNVFLQTGSTLTAGDSKKEETFSANPAAVKDKMTQMLTRENWENMKQTFKTANRARKAVNYAYYGFETVATGGHNLAVRIPLMVAQAQLAETAAEMVVNMAAERMMDPDTYEVVAEELIDEVDQQVFSVLEEPDKFIEAISNDAGELFEIVENDAQKSLEEIQHLVNDASLNVQKDAEALERTGEKIAHKLSELPEKIADSNLPTVDVAHCLEKIQDVLFSLPELKLTFPGWCQTCAATCTVALGGVAIAAHVPVVATVAATTIIVGAGALYFETLQNAAQRIFLKFLKMKSGCPVLLQMNPKDLRIQKEDLPKKFVEVTSCQERFASFRKVWKYPTDQCLTDKFCQKNGDNFIVCARGGVPFMGFKAGSNQPLFLDSTCSCKAFGFAWVKMKKLHPAFHYLCNAPPKPKKKLDVIKATEAVTAMLMTAYQCE